MARFCGGIAERNSDIITWTKKDIGRYFLRDRGANVLYGKR